MRDLGIVFMVIAIWAVIWAAGDYSKNPTTEYILSVIILNMGGLLFILGGGRK